MKMFASDLDRTLIYSDRALTEFREIRKDGLIGVESKDEREIAFMLEKSYDFLLEISKRLLFVPVTTRTLDQFNRIHIFSKTIPLTYAVTSNGANIMHNGAPLMEWNQLVQNRLKIECASIAEMITVMNGYNIQGNLKQVENLFFYYLLENKVDLETEKKIKHIVSTYGWRISIQGRKLYVIPKPVSKGEAVKFIKEKEQIKTVFGAGDSLLDDDFLKLCEYSFVPLHGELAKDTSLNKQYLFTENRGVKAGEEILAEIREMTREMIYSG